MNGRSAWKAPAASAYHKDDCMWTSHDACRISQREDDLMWRWPQAKTSDEKDSCRPLTLVRGGLDADRPSRVPMPHGDVVVVARTNAQYIASRTSEGGAMECVWNDNTCTSKAALEDCRIWLVTVTTTSL
ncbi:hypothetical protein H257_11918 [Aphanomyces astaci]|uniref:Uncharacterized protein n=1 Tax=Aphanomyces astaci TaxID=112090 RepID=W4G239_APHAT|nr:hypothetical protein H257_11918 [Aphanomyces astaci]ETV73094.1 hypothetical protein H257_11918 [Aphanomyces astaci]|eukprot:XP_009837299.1 hypothetical protein H257_11918 [Aphanomyces astaci]